MRRADVIGHDRRQPAPHLLIIYSCLSNLFYSCVCSTPRVVLYRKFNCGEKKKKNESPCKECEMYSIIYETWLIIQTGISAGFELFSLQSHTALHREISTVKISSGKSLLTSNLLHVFSKSIYLVLDLRVIYKASYTEQDCDVLWPSQLQCRNYDYISVVFWQLRFVVLDKEKKRNAKYCFKKNNIYIYLFKSRSFNLAVWKWNATLGCLWEQMDKWDPITSTQPFHSLGQIFTPTISKFKRKIT